MESEPDWKLTAKAVPVEDRWIRLLTQYLKIRKAQLLFNNIGTWLQTKSKGAKERVKDAYPIDKK